MARSKTRPNDYLVRGADKRSIIGDLRHQPDGRYKATHNEYGVVGFFPTPMAGLVAVRTATGPVRA